MQCSTGFVVPHSAWYRKKLCKVASNLQKASHVQLLACEGMRDTLVIQQIASTLGDVGHSHHKHLKRVSDAALVAEERLLLQILEALLQGSSSKAALCCSNSE